jgi:DNA-binding LacI/PurR family transcriptional regulator
MKSEQSVPQPPKARRTNLRDLANHLGVSQTTVSLVLNNAPQAQGLSAETHRRVLEAAKQFNYRPSYFARNLGKTRSESIGVIAPELSEGYFTVVMGGVERYLVKRHFLYFTACHYWQPELLQRYPQLLVDRGAEGLLLLNTNADFACQVPVVAISGHKAGPGVTNVILDHAKSAQLALKHLYDLGHRKIAFMHGHQHVIDAQYRWEATVCAAREFGIIVRPELTVRLLSGGWSPTVGYGPVKRLLEKTQDFTAILCFNDTSAIGAIRALKEAGRSVPGDVSVIGFDDILSAEFQVPSLTTIRQPLEKMGKVASEVLLDKIEHPEKDQPGEIVMEPKLVVRESTGPMRSSKTGVSLAPMRRITDRLTHDGNGSTAAQPQTPHRMKR